MDFNVQDIDWSQDPKRLREIYKQTNFDSEFYKLIRKDVVAILSPQLITDPHNLIYDDEIIYKHLIGRLERFIFNLDDDANQDDVDKIIEHIKTLKQPTKMCRKVLKTGDVLFSCNDCGLDGTCVVCIDCFHKSAHKDHNYRMSNTDGGGCCDCGDIEAWKQYPACSDHMAPDQPNPSLSDFEDINVRRKQVEIDEWGITNKISLLSKNMPERFFLVCQACLHYARLMLTWEDYINLPDFLEVPESDPDLYRLLDKNKSSRNYFTVLYNDEVHTYDHVINTLVKIIRCTKMTASIMASTVSRDGRSLILNGTFKECTLTHHAIIDVRDSGQGPLKVEVFHGVVLAHQGFALKLIEWIQRMSLLCDAFRVLTAFTLLGTYDPIQNQENVSSGSETLLERIMLSNTKFWKVARIDWNDIFVTTLLTEYSIKEKFARLITRIYPKLMQDFIIDDHDHSVSILALTTQLYTVPSLICMLIEEEDALSIISQTLLDTYRNTKRETSAISFENRHTFDLLSLKRGFYIIPDLRHLINIEPTKWTPKMRANVTQSVKIFLNLLDSMQGMDSVKRQLGQHLEYEPEWETGMNLQSRLAPYISRLVNYCGLDDEVLIETLKETQIRLFGNVSFKTVTREMLGHRATCIHYDVSTSPVSVHLPLTRFAAALILKLMQKRPCNQVPYDESLVILDQNSESNKHSMIEIMEPSLRTEVMIAQFRSGMWRRNGYSLVNQILYFSGPLLRKEMLDRDILVLQECAATCDANEFLIHLINKFNLSTWATAETSREPLVGPKAISFYNDEEIMTQTMSLGEEFLQLLLTIIGERYRVGVGKIEPDDVIKNELIQILCIGPFTRSDLTQKLFVNDNELDCVKAVANLRRSNELSTGKYELKEDYYVRFNRFFYHYNRRGQSHALDAQLKRKRTLKEPLICCPPPPPVELTDQFKNLNELLKCDVTLIIIQKILRRALGPPVDSQECSTKAPIRFLASDLQLDQCLHLIGMSLLEQERDLMGFKFVEAAYEKDIFNLLKDCYEIAKRSRDMICWIMEKTMAIVDKLKNSELTEHQTKICSTIRDRFGSILSSSDTIEQESRKKNSEMAARRRERIMAQMKAKQKEFLSNPSTQQLISETEQKGPSKPTTSSSVTTAQSIAAVAAAIAGGLSPSTSSIIDVHAIVQNTRNRLSEFAGKRSQRQSKRGASSEEVGMDCEPGKSTKSSAVDDGDDDDDDDEMMDADDDTQAAIVNELDDTEPIPVEESHLCILCRDEQKVGFDKQTMVLLAYVQRSAVLSKNRGERRIPNYALTPSNQLKHLFLTQPNIKPSNSPELYSFTSDNSWSFDATFMPSDLFFGPYISTCGHVMHYDCWQGFFDAVVKRETSRLNRSSRHTSFDLTKNEILCPLCECISNATIPLLPDFSRLTRRQLQAALDPCGGTIFGSTKKTIELSAENLSACLQALRGTVDSPKQVRHIKASSSATSSSSSTDGFANLTGIGIKTSLGEDKYMRLLQPRPINDVLEELDETEAFKLRDFIATIKSDKIPSSICTKNLLGSIAILADRIHSIGLDLDKSISDVHHARVFMMTSWTVAYTIQAYERTARFKGTPIFEDLESSKNLCLSALLRFSMGSLMTYQSDMLQSLLVKKLRYLLVPDEHLSSSPCCLDIDAFETFVSIYILLQKLYSHIDDSSASSSSKLESSPSPSSSSSKRESLSSERIRSLNDSLGPGSCSLIRGWGSGSDASGISGCAGGNDKWRAITTRAFDHEYFRNILHLILIMNLLQVSITMQNEHSMTYNADVDVDDGDEDHMKHDKTTDNNDDEDQPSTECVMLHNFYKDIMLAAGHPINKLPIMNEKFVQQIRARLLPFLRSCGIFFYHLSHIKPDETLRTKSAFCEGRNFPSQDLTAIGLARRQSSYVSISELLESDERRKREFASIDLAASDREFESICNYLNLPNNFSLLLKSRDAKQLAGVWLRHSRVIWLIKSGLEKKNVASAMSMSRSTLASSSATSASASTSSVPGTAAAATTTTTAAAAAFIPSSETSSMSNLSSELMPLKFIRQPHLVNRLIDLPYDYSELVDKVSDFKCPSIRNEDSRTPTMCLVCGVMLCSQSYCCQRDLNDLASNYKQILSRQEEARQQLIAMASAAAAAAAAAASNSTTTTSGSGNHLATNNNQAAPTSSIFAPPYLMPNQPSAPPVTPGDGTTGARATGAGGIVPAHSIGLAFLRPQAAGAATTTNTGAVGRHHLHHRNQGPDSDRSVESLFNPHIGQQLVGSCTYHAHECSGGVGIFLRIRNCQILLLSGRTKGCYMPAPYIDDHGETDFGLARGNPLHLNKEHYERLQLMWMSHSIPEQTSRTLEYSSYHSNITWHIH